MIYTDGKKFIGVQNDEELNDILLNDYLWSGENFIFTPEGYFLQDTEDGCLKKNFCKKVVSSLSIKDILNIQKEWNGWNTLDDLDYFDEEQDIILEKIKDDFLGDVIYCLESKSYNKIYNFLNLLKEKNKTFFFVELHGYSQGEICFYCNFEKEVGYPSKEEIEDLESVIYGSWVEFFISNSKGEYITQTGCHPGYVDGDYIDDYLDSYIKDTYHVRKANKEITYY